MSKKTIVLTILFSLFFISASFAAGNNYGSEDSGDRENIGKFFDNTKEMLKKEEIDGIKQYFSEGYYGGYQELENRLTRKWQNQQIVNMEFSINTILKNDGLYNVQIKWDKSYLDNKGQPRKKSGICEVILKPVKKSYKILNVRGRKFF